MELGSLTPAVRHLDAEVRRMTTRDLPEVLAIDQESFPRPWALGHFLEVLKSPGGVGLVAEANAGGAWRPRVVGFAVCERRRGAVTLLSFAVDPRLRRSGVGRQLLGRVRELAACERARKVVVTVGESNLAAQLFLRALGFRALKVLRDYFPDSGEDGFRFELGL